MNKKTIYLIGVLLVSILGMIILNISKSSTEEYLKDQVVENISFTNADIEFNDNETTFKVKAKNTNKSDYELSYIEIIIKDEEGKEIENLIGYIGNVIKPNEEKEIVTNVDKTLNNIKSIEYKIVK